MKANRLLLPLSLLPSTLLRDRCRMNEQGRDEVLEIIGPAARDRASCIHFVEARIRRMTPVGPVPGAAVLIGAWQKELAKHAAVLRRAVTIIRSPRMRLENDEASNPSAIEYLDRMASEIEALIIKPVGRRPHMLKLKCASSAFETLEQFGRRPTLTADGAFYRLATLYYELVTGIPLQNLEWHCRTVSEEAARRRRAALMESKDFLQDFHQ